MKGALRRSCSSPPSLNRNSDLPGVKEVKSKKLLSYSRSYSNPEIFDQVAVCITESSNKIFKFSSAEKHLSYSRNSSKLEGISSMIEENFMTIPPPAGFRTPSHSSFPSNGCGTSSLDKSASRLASFHKHIESSFQIKDYDKSPHKLSVKAQSLEETNNGGPYHEGKLLSELPPPPPSPPPSPFQYPIFKRQLKRFQSESSAFMPHFGLGRLNPLFQMVPTMKARPHSSHEDECSREYGDENLKSVQSSTCSTNLIEYYKDTKYQRSYKMPQFVNEYVSETDSDDEEVPLAFPLSQNLTNLRDISNSQHHDKSIQNSQIRHAKSLSMYSPETGSKLQPEDPSNIDNEIVCQSTSESENPHRPALNNDECYHCFSTRDSKRDSEFVGPNDFNSDAESCQEIEERKELFNVAHEILVTERSYVKVLHLIDQEFQFRIDQENRAHNLFSNEQMPLIFSNIKSIFKLHHDFLLPQLEERMANWKSCGRIGDIMKCFAPFLKMYTDYIRNFDNAMSLISFYQANCQRFAAVMDEIHQMDVCGNLTLQHHMLSPVQRIPRYEMLLRDYLKKLPDADPDREDTERALQLVSAAASHANDAMKKIEKFHKLLEVQESLGGSIDLVSPTRELIKEGRIMKISYRSGDHKERYLFLFTDMLLLCTPRLMSGRVISGPQYRLRAKFNVENLQVLEGDNLETANTFYIRDSNKCIELHTNTQIEKESWLEAVFLAIYETQRRKSSLKLSSSHHESIQTPHHPDLGLKQPALIKLDSVSKCMHCSSQFSVVKRKYHCRACGFIFCNKCSNFKVNLTYDNGKSGRVCQDCHEVLKPVASGAGMGPIVPNPHRSSDPENRNCNSFSFNTRGLLEISAKSAGATMQGYLQLKTHRKTWVKRWFALQCDFVLYSFKSEDDEQALTATPVPGLTVSYLQQASKTDSGISEKDREKAFKLHHAKKQYIFLSSSLDDASRWISALSSASRAELPNALQ